MSIAHSREARGGEPGNAADDNTKIMCSHGLTENERTFRKTSATVEPLTRAIEKCLSDDEACVMGEHTSMPRSHTLCRSDDRDVIRSRSLARAACGIVDGNIAG